MCVTNLGPTLRQPEDVAETVGDVGITPTILQERLADPVIVQTPRK